MPGWAPRRRRARARPHASEGSGEDGRTAVRRVARMRRGGRTALAAVLLAVPLAAPGLSAQDGRVPRPPAASIPAHAAERAPQWPYLAGNVVLGAGLSAGRAWLGGRPLRPALVRGAAGGLGIYTGLRLVGTGRDPWRFVGLQTTAVGASVVRNAGEGRGALSHVTLTAWPLLVELERPAGDGWRVRPRLSATAAWSLVSLLRDDALALEWDARASLAVGQVVLRSRLPHAYPRGVPDDAACALRRCDGGVYGQSRAGIVWYPAATTDRVGGAGATLTHELVHAAQATRDVVPIAAPLSDALLARTGRPGRLLARLLVLDVVRPIRSTATMLGALGDGSGDALIEREAEAMRGVEPCAVLLGRCVGR